MNQNINTFHLHTSRTTLFIFVLLILNSATYHAFAKQQLAAEESTTEEVSNPDNTGSTEVVTLRDDVDNSVLQYDPKDELEEPIGEEPEEDMHRVFLRDSTVLLNPGEFEFDFGFSYVRTETEQVVVLFDGSIGMEELRTRDLRVPVSLRFGLADRLEGYISSSVAYGHVERTDLDETSRASEFGFGDIATGIKFNLIDEAENQPNIILSIGISAPLGDDPYDQEFNEVSLGSGHWSATGGLTIVKSSDPVVLFGSLDYTHTFKRTVLGQDVLPGGAIGYNLGFGFAINENLTLSSQFQGTYKWDTEVDSTVLSGSSQEPMSVRFGITYRLGSGQFIEPSVLFGLNNDSSDVSVGVMFTRKF